MDLEHIKNILKTEDKSLIKRVADQVKDTLTGLWRERLPADFVEALAQYERTWSEEDRYALLIEMIDKRVGPQNVKIDTLRRALQADTEDGRRAFTVVGQKLAAGVWEQSENLSATNPQVSVTLAPGNVRVGLPGDQLALGIELMFRTADFTPDRWQRTEVEVEQLLNAIPLSGNEPWRGVKVKRSARVAGMCSLWAWHRLNLPIMTMICKVLLTR